MRGVSRASLAEVEERLEPLTADPQVATALGDELFAVAGLLASQPALRRALADPSRPAEASSRPRRHRCSPARSAPQTADLVAAAAAARWSAPGDLTDAVEQLAVQAVVAAAEQRTTSTTWRTSCSGSAGSSPASQSLRMALTNPFVSADAKRQLLSQLLTGKVTPEALRLISEAAPVRSDGALT